ncbi:MAG: ATP-binding protein [Acidobacteriota bacterium]
MSAPPPGPRPRALGREVSGPLAAIELLTSVGRALSTEKDPDRLMELIVDAAKALTQADGGTLYSRTGNRLEFEIMMTDSLGLHLGGTSGQQISLPALPLFDDAGQPNERRVAARAALSGETVNIPDVYDERELDFAGTREFDKQTGYRSRSFLTVPMMDYLDEVIGVLQLINAQGYDGEVVAFTLEDQRLVESLASQAATTLARERLITELEQAKDRAEASSRSKSAFVANISHELRTPMNVVLGMTQLALETELDADQEEMLRTVALSAESQLGLVNDILDCSKIEADKLDLDTVPFELRETLDNSLRGLAEQAEMKDLKIHSRVAEDLPSHFSGDPGRLRQVIVNLVGNAIKFTAAGEITLEVSALESSDRRRNDDRQETVSLRFAVNDTGCGIPLEEHEQIFDAFTQVDGTPAPSRGTGLGLSICKKLVELMGGEIWVDSQPGQGSTFHFTARFGRVEAEDVPSVGHDAEAEAGAQRPQPMHILVAEDSPLSQKLMHRLLAQQDHSTVMTNDGREALEAFQRDRFDLVLMDVQLPKLDGLETTRKIRLLESSTGRHTPIVALTASARKGDRETCLQAGMDAYLTKPLDREKLFGLIQALGAKGRSLQAAADAGRPAVFESQPATVRHLSLLNHKTAVLDCAKTLARCDNDPEFTLEIVDLFLEQTSTLKSELYDAAAADDSDTVRRLAHRLAGAATNVSGYRVEETARQLMKTADGELGEVTLSLTQLDCDLADLEQALAGFRLDLEKGTALCAS